MMIMIKQEQFQWVTVLQYHPLCSAVEWVISLVSPLWLRYFLAWCSMQRSFFRWEILCRHLNDWLLVHIFHFKPLDLHRLDIYPFHATTSTRLHHHLLHWETECILFLSFSLERLSSPITWCWIYPDLKLDSNLCFSFFSKWTYQILWSLAFP